MRSERVPQARLERTERHRWSALTSVVLLIAGQSWIATRLGLEPWWVLPLLTGACAAGSWIAVLIPGRNRFIDRALGVALVGLLALGTVVSTLVFVTRVFLGSGLSPAELVLTGAVLWSQSVGVFGMVYWEIDGGGPVERATARHWHAVVGLHVPPAAAGCDREVEPVVRRLLVRVAHERYRLFAHRHYADVAPSQAGHGSAISDVGHDSRRAGRSRGEHRQMMPARD